MSVKTITITERAYKLLKMRKGKDESFSDVITKIAEGPALEEFYGILSPVSARKLEAAIRKVRSVRNRRHTLRRERIRKELR